MADSETPEATAGPAPDAERSAFVTIPVQARDEIGELAFYIAQVLQNLREVNEHVRGSSETMPGVLHELRDIVKMTEVATVRVLEETEALMEESQRASRLVRAARDAGHAEAGDSLATVQTLVDGASGRAMEIMSALEFQDLTAQKVGRAFEVLEEVGTRLRRIQALVDLGQRPGAGAPRRSPGADIQADSRAGQALADEILLQFQG